MKFEREKIEIAFHSQIVFSSILFVFCFLFSRINENYVLTTGMTSAGFRRFFVRRQNSINTTRIKMIITNDTDATMILNTGLVSNGKRKNKFQN